jgi:FixJ family two-component response regulator
VSQGKICIVDDDASVRRALRRFLCAAGYEVELYVSGSAYLDAAIQPPPCCLVVDIRMPVMNGLELQQKISGTPRALPIVFITGHGTAEVRAAALSAGCVTVLDKPLEEKELLDAIEQALALSNHLHANEGA